MNIQTEKKLEDLKMEKLSKKTKLIITSVGVIAALAVGGSVYASNQSKQKLDEAQKVITTKTTGLTDLEVKINKLFDDKDNNFLAKNVTKDQVKTLREEFDRLSIGKQTEKVDLKEYNKEAGDTEKALKALEKKVDAQTAINQLFKQEKENAALNGSVVKKDLSIVDDLKKETVESTKKEYYKKDSKTAYDKAINDLIVNAENQVKQIETAKQAVSKIFKENKVISTDHKLYDTAKTETDKIKNAKAKKSLNDQLSKVKTDIEKKAEESKKQSEAKEAASADSMQQPQNGVTSPGTVEAAQEQVQTDQGAATTDYTGDGAATDTGGYVPQGGTDTGYQQPQYQAPPAEQAPQTPPTGGQSTPPGDNGGSNTIHLKPEDIQGSENNNHGGTNEWWGFE